MDKRSIISSEDLNKTSLGDHHRSDSNKYLNEETISQFDPKLSSREMRKIKYYEDMFARMANDDKNLIGTSSSSLTNMYSSVKTVKHRTARTKNYDKKDAEPKTGTKITVPETVHKDILLENNRCTDNTVGRLSPKGVLARSASDYGVLDAKDKSKIDPDARVNTFVKRGKSLIDERRLYKFQSMPSVTKKSKRIDSLDTKQNETTIPIPFDVRDTDGSLNKNMITESIIPDSNKLSVKLDSLYKQKLFMSSIEIPKLKPKLDASPIKNIDDTNLNKSFDDSNTTGDQLNGVKITKDIDTSICNDIYDQDPCSLSIQKQDSCEKADLLSNLTQKKPPRGKRSKPKRYSLAVNYATSDDIDVLDANTCEYVSESKLELGSVEEHKTTVKTRTKSQKVVGRKKKQEDLGIIYDVMDKANSIKENRSISKSAPSKAHKCSFKSDKQDSTPINNIDHDIIDNLLVDENRVRIITMDEAELMLNTYVSTRSITVLKDIIGESISNRHFGYIEHMANENAAPSSVIRSIELRPTIACFLDPKNISAPARREKSHDNITNEIDLPQNPLELSFRYKFFKTII